MVQINKISIQSLLLSGVLLDSKNMIIDATEGKYEELSINTTHAFSIDEKGDISFSRINGVDTDLIVVRHMFDNNESYRNKTLALFRDKYSLSIDQFNLIQFSNEDKEDVSLLVENGKLFFMKKSYEVKCSSDNFFMSYLAMKDSEEKQMNQSIYEKSCKIYDEMISYKKDDIKNVSLDYGSKTVYLTLSLQNKENLTLKAKIPYGVSYEDVEFQAVQLKNQIMNMED